MTPAQMKNLWLIFLEILQEIVLWGNMSSSNEAWKQLVLDDYIERKANIGNSDTNSGGE